MSKRNGKMDCATKKTKMENRKYNQRIQRRKKRIIER
jgi:hypothetical protein